MTIAKLNLRHRKPVCGNTTLSSVLLLSIAMLVVGAFSALGDAQATTIAGTSRATAGSVTTPALGSTAAAAAGSFVRNVAKVAEQFRSGAAKTSLVWGDAVDLVAIARSGSEGMVDLRARVRTQGLRDPALRRDLKAVRSVAQVGFKTDQIDKATLLFSDGLLHVHGKVAFDTFVGKSLGKHVTLDVNGIGGDARSLVVRPELPNYAILFDGTVRRLNEVRFSDKTYSTVAGPFGFDELVAEGSAMTWLNEIFDPYAAVVARWEAKPVTKGFRGLARDYAQGAKRVMTETIVNEKQAADAAAFQLRENLAWPGDPPVATERLTNGNIVFTAYLPPLTRSKLKRVNGALADALQGSDDRWPITMSTVDFAYGNFRK